MSESMDRVFVVDDDASVGRSLGRLLKAAGYEVVVLGSAEEFMERAPFEDVGCLVLDIQMPGLNGIELQEVLARSNCAPPIVFITGHGDLPMNMSAIEAGAVDFIPKPCSEDSLLKAVEKALLKWRQEKGKSLAGTDLRDSSQT